MAGLLETNIPALVVTVSIIVSGIFIGLGRATGYKNIERFGFEEFTQGLINAALFGSAVVLIATAQEIGRNSITAQCLIGAAPIDEIVCILQQQLIPASGLLLGEINRVLSILGYYQTLNLNFGAFSIQPLTNLESTSHVLGSQLGSLEMTALLLYVNLFIVQFISQHALELFFSIGLVFRMFFATRKFGGFLIALSLGLYLIYPSFILAFNSPDHPLEERITSAYSEAHNFTNNTAYATVPIVDLNDNYAIAQRIDYLSGRGHADNSTNETNQTIILPPSVDLTSDTTTMMQANAAAISDLYIAAIIAPIFSLILTIVFIKELGNILGGEISIFSLV